MSIYKSSSLAMIPTAYKDGKLYSIRPVPEYGAELVTNGTFDTDSNWTKGTGWTISGGTANCDGTQTTNSLLYQNLGDLSNKTIKLTFTISGYSAGQLSTAFFGAAGTQVKNVSANGTYTFDIDVQSGHNGNTGFTANSSFIGSVDNVSVKEVIVDGDFDFSRGSNLAATRVASSGYIEKGRENLYTQSNNFSHSDWTPKAGTFTQGVADPDGGNNAWAWEATNTDPYLYQSKNFTGVHTLSIYVKGVGSTIGDDFQIRVGNALKDVTLTGHWQRVEHFGVLSGSINIGFEYGNPATAGDIVHIYAAQLELGTIATDYIDSGSSTAQAGILEDMPRLDYSGGATCPSLLLEPQRTNSVTQSEYLGSWTKNNSSVTDNDSISPQGVQNASAIVGDGSTNYHWIQRDSGSGTSGTTYTTSFFAKKGSVNFVQLVLDSPVFGVMHQNFDLENGTIGSGSGSTTPFIENYDNGWYRVGVTATATGTATIKPLIALANSNTMGRFASFATSGDIKIFGVQVEAGSYPASYIPTYGSSVTRSVDSCVSSSLTTSTDFTIFFEAPDFCLINGSTGGSYDNIQFVFSSDGSPYSSNGSYHIYNNVLYHNNGSGGNQDFGNIYNNQTDSKFVIMKRGDKVLVFANGTKKTEATLPSGGNVLTWDTINLTQSLQDAQGDVFNPYYKQIVKFDTALTDSECIALTTL